MSEREAETMQETNEPESEARPTSEEDGRSRAAAADAQRPVDEAEMSPAQADDDDRAPLLPGDEAVAATWGRLSAAVTSHPRHASYG